MIFCVFCDKNFKEKIEQFRSIFNVVMQILECIGIDIIMFELLEKVGILEDNYYDVLNVFMKNNNILLKRKFVEICVNFYNLIIMKVLRVNMDI